MQNRQTQDQQNIGSQEQKVLTFSQFDQYQVMVKGKYFVFTEQVEYILKSISGNCLEASINQRWLIPQREYHTVLDKLGQLDDIIIKITLLSQPSILARISKPMPNKIEWRDGGTVQCIQFDPVNVNISQLDPQLFDKLYQYQRDCITMGIDLNCRVLIADEMGVGKTVESLALASLYRDQWPLLIICPAHLKLIWQDEIIKWLQLQKSAIQIVQKQSQLDKTDPSVFIISYNLCIKFKESIISRQFKIGIADECHYLKSTQAQRSKTCVSILKYCQHVLLLSGTPALSKPKDLFNQLSIIRPDIFINFYEFGDRFCNPQFNIFTNGIDYDGASHSDELYKILTQYIMIRRLKQEVLEELPEKRRLKLRIQGDSQYTKQIAALLAQDDPQAIIMQCYVLSGQAKIKAIKEHLGEMIQNKVKFLFFAFHTVVLDAVQEFCEQKNVQYVRMDGTISQEQRHHNVKQFQENYNVRIAILGLAALCTGITLTAASAVVFGEMHWTPAMMLQAEDRAHRIGQKNCVDCYYMIGDGTIDQLIYNTLEKKFNTVSNFIDGENNQLNAHISHSILEQQIEPEIQQHVDLDMDELIDILKPRKKKKMKLKQTQSQTQTQAQEIQQEQEDRQLLAQFKVHPRNSPANLKQQKMTQYMKSTNKDSNQQVIEIAPITFVEDPNQSHQQKVVDKPKEQLLIQQPQQGQLKKKNQAYFEQQLKSDNKETEQNEQPQFIDSHSKCIGNEERFDRIKKQG